MKLAKSRKWTDAEVLEAKQYIQQQRPGLWERLIEIEIATGDFRDLDEFHILSGLISIMHPECEGNERIDLLVALRMLWTAESR